MTNAPGLEALAKARSWRPSPTFSTLSSLHHRYTKDPPARG